MTSKSRIATILSVIIIALVAVALVVAYRASQHVPDFYNQELAIQPEAQVKESDRMLQQATTLHNAIRREGQWQEVFTAATINGWLAVDLPRNHPQALPAGMSNPRVHIAPNGVTLACQIDRSGFHGVISLEVDAYIESPNVIGLRIHQARLGALPWSLDRVLRGISDAARQSSLVIQWRQTDGDPVALITLPHPSASKGKVFRIETIRLDENSITIAGTTAREK